MQLKNMRFLLLITLGLWACGDSTSDELDSIEPIIFGLYYGHCFGEMCIETFKIENGKLYEDQSDDYSKSAFDFVLLSDDLYHQVKDIVDHIPQELREINGQTFGCPDCADQGGVFLELFDQSDAESNMKFFIDQSPNDTPKYLHDFVDRVNEKIALLQ